MSSGRRWRQLLQAYTGYVYGDSTCGQAVLYGIGQTGIPILNVNNNSSTGSSALFLARRAIASGVLRAELVRTRARALPARSVSSATVHA